MYATTINMSNDARLTAQLYADVKKNANITDTWLPIGGKTMLKVSDTSETLLQVGLTQEDKRIYRRYINDEGKNEYEWASANHESLKHQRYVGGSYYESFYRTNDGFLDWFVIDNSRGYWNCLRLSEFDYEGDENDCYQITNSIVGDEICLEFTIRFYKNGKYDMLHGQDETILPCLAMGGAQGGIGGTTNYNGCNLVGIIEAWKNGDIEKARELQNFSQEVINVICHFRGNIVGGKRIMKLIGLDLGKNRTPFQNMTDEEEARMKAELEAIDFFNRCNKF